MNAPRDRHFFVFFLVSGFCGLLYEVVWTRLAMAHFGVTTTVVSVVLSVFMAGLALGSWIASWPSLLRKLRSGRTFLRGYAFVELLIGTGAFAVPSLFDRGHTLLLGLGAADSHRYHVVSGLLLTAAMLPWATLMGTTYALAMGALRTVTADGDERSFSYLYLANVLGAAVGTVATALVFVEVLGFRRTLLVAAILNATIFVLAWLHSSRPAFDVPAAPPLARSDGKQGDGALLAVLFATGFASMALELVWTRLYSRFLGTFVYSFAAILAVYLLATYAGSVVYRRRADRGQPTHADVLWALLGLFSILPLAFADRRLWLGFDGSDLTPLTLVGITPFCAALGYLTPLLVDRYSGGDEGAASRAYSINVIGCIFGPLVAGYLLLPLVGERGAITLLALVPAVIGLWAVVRAADRRTVTRAYVVALALTAVVPLVFRSYAESIPGAVIKHDHVATVVAFKEHGENRLLVNGAGITSQTTLTKVMAHLPMASLPSTPHAVLDICFGMGTTFRAITTWGVRAVAVDLVPSVPALFDYFSPGGSQLLSPGHVDIVIDDGRRYLQRTPERFDVITIDPPPPVQSAGSSLLYSREFYVAVKSRLADDGILQQWLPTSEPMLTASVVRSLVAEFPYVRAFGGIEGWGLHFLASRKPLPRLTAAELVARMPAAARVDLAEWLPGKTAEGILADTLAREVDPQSLIDKAPGLVELTDDRPTNEYFLLRTLRARLFGK